MKNNDIKVRGEDGRVWLNAGVVTDKDSPRYGQELWVDPTNGGIMAHSDARIEEERDPMDLPTRGELKQIFNLLQQRPEALYVPNTPSNHGTFFAADGSVVSLVDGQVSQPRDNRETHNVLYVRR